MKKNIIALSLTAALLIPANANAGLFSSMYDIPSQMMELMSKLSDDIGVMADRIGEMADRILIMADKIGEMADRIVQTEELMTNTMLQMQENMNATGASNTLAQSGSVLLLTPSHTSASTYSAPDIILSDNASSYLLYVSTSPMIDAVNTSSILVQEASSIDTLWHEIVAKTTSKTVYIAVKSLHDNQLSTLSNAVAIDIN